MTIHEGARVKQKVIRYIGRSGSHPSLLGRPNMEIGLSPKPTSLITVSSMPNHARIHKMKTPARQIALAMAMYYGGMPLDAIQQQFRQDYSLDMSESNYWN